MTESRFRHVIVTRFSYRGAPLSRTYGDPLDPHRLSRRFAAFEIACLPGMRAQTEQRFAWVLVVDPDLPAPFRERLRALAATRPGTHLETYHPDLAIESLGWLSRLADPDATHLLTTSLDDDDALHPEYVGRLHAAVRDLDAGGGLPALKLFGARTALQWDLCHGRGARLGHVKPWLRRGVLGRTYPTLSGFSALARRDALDLSSYFFRHSQAEDYLAADDAFARLPAQARCNVERERERLRRALARAGLDRDTARAAGAFADVGGEGPAALLLNTTTNVQRDRIFEFRDRRTPVVDADSFSGIVVDLDRARRYLAAYGGAREILPVLAGRVARRWWGRALGAVSGARWGSR